MLLCRYVLAPVLGIEEVDSTIEVERFKSATLRKLEGLKCASHGKGPAVEFHGASLRDIRISMRCCCREMSALANRAIARPL
ncbi:MAG TPA: hypothetical protein VGL53_08335 [Bryobacteraceae bacterium]|jgi:hypothetical protein